ncbi:MAG: chromosome segregation protein SMC [Ruminococcaceae bacterium]|nr:chromosome segregation protein SMC [Oscillospiraceae bacterium]
MQGFKSFADKIDLEFGHGITAIVGPNGSGKSNVSDAIRWVMGEQSAKTLRGSKMEDVIFSGTTQRKPMGFAEVSIILDNKDKSLNIDFDEVVVTRRVHRSGESEYLINKSPCRLKDIHELFMDTGIGREGYSVVGQGKIDQILSNKSEDRRHIFEEAAGISKFKFRKNEAEKELLKTEDNLTRIRDILTELSSQVGPLEIQSKKARKYLDLREVLKVLEVNIAMQNIDKYRKISKESEEALKISLNQLETSKNEQKEIELKLENSQNESIRLNDEINKVKEQRFSLEKDEGSTLNKIELCKNDIANNNLNKERLSYEIEQLNKKLVENENNGNILTFEFNNRNNDVKDKEKNIEMLIKKSDEIKAENSKLFDDIESKKGEIIEFLNKNSSLKASLSSLDVISGNFTNRDNAVKDEINQKETIIKENEIELGTIEEKISSNTKICQKEKDELEKIKKDYFKITEENDNLKKQQNDVASKFNQKLSRRKALEDLERSFEGYTKSVKVILANKSINGICGVVSKLLEVDSKYVVAVETALGRALQNIVVKDENCAKKCIEMLKTSNSGRATFMPLTSISSSVLTNVPKNESGYIDLAHNLISYKSEYKNIFEFLLGKTVVVDNIDNAIKISKKYGYKFRIVTLDGQILNAGGTLTGGSIDKHFGLISRSKEIEELKVEITNLQKEIDKIDDKIEKNIESIRLIADKKEKIDSSIAMCQHEDVRLNSQKTLILTKIKECKDTILLLNNEIGNINKEIDDIKTQKNDYNNQIKENEENILNIRSILNSLEQSYEEELVKESKTEEEITNAKISLNDTLKDIEHIKTQLESLLNLKAEIEGDIKSKNNDLDEFSTQNELLSSQILELQSNMKNSKDVFDNLEKQEKDLQMQYTNTLDEIKRIQISAKEKQDVVFVLGQEVTRCENKVAKAEADTESVINKLWEDYEITYTDATVYQKDIGNLSDAIKEANSLKRQIKELGNVNVDAIEEYKIVKERHEFLSNQEADLNKAKANLTDIITKMQSIMKEKFIASFDLIKVEFNNVFRELFGGGIAKLYFSDDSNILESGIEIEVQPPGKKLQNLTLLSGGERAFSAIALLFAVLKTAPTPFCLLDEVEAALDEVNVYKFADYAKKYSKNTQFLIVTHRRGTMEAADIMYGVTMQEKGVSKLLKLNFDDLEEYDV